MNYISRANSASNILESRSISTKSAANGHVKSYDDLTSELDPEPIWRRRSSSELKHHVKDTPPLAGVHNYHNHHHSLGNNKQAAVTTATSSVGKSKNIHHDANYLLWITPVAAR